MGDEGVGDHPGSLAPGAGTGHGQVGGDVTVLGVGGNLYDESGQLGFGQSAVGHGGLGRSGQQRAGLAQGSRAGVVVLVGLFEFSHCFILSRADPLRPLRVQLSQRGALFANERNFALESTDGEGEPL